MKINLNLYKKIIDAFLSKKISAKCFEYVILRVFSEEQGKQTKQEFAILNKLFFDIEDFCDNPELIDEHDIDEKELRKRCTITLKKLEALSKIKE